METIADELREKGVSDSNLIYLDLDKRGLRRITTPDQLDELLSTYDKVSGLKYLFLTRSRM